MMVKFRDFQKANERLALAESGPDAVIAKGETTQIMSRLWASHREMLADKNATSAEKRASAQCQMLGSLISLVIGLVSNDDDLVRRAGIIVR